MSVEACEAGGVSKSGNIYHKLMNPIMEVGGSPNMQMNSPGTPRFFDFYIDPMAAFSNNNRMSKGSSNQDSPASSSSLPTSVSKCYVFKSRLQEYAQKVGFITPVYETIKEGPSHEPTFRSTVIVNEVRYESLPGFYNRKAAEQSAAEVALVALANSGEMSLCISQPVHETGLCKNLLQEYAQKMNYAIPSYEIVKVNGPGRVPHFSCTATIGEIKYIGAGAKTKKEAEIKAARTALLSIQSSGTGSNTPNESTYTVIPCKKKAVDLAPQTPKTTSALDSKKRRFKKKQRKRRRSGGERNCVQVEFVSAVHDQNPNPFPNSGGILVSENAMVRHQPMAENGQQIYFHQIEMGVPNMGITLPPINGSTNMGITLPPFNGSTNMGITLPPFNGITLPPINGCEMHSVPEN